MPGLIELQVRAIAEAAVERLKADVERLQAAIDRYLILQGRPRRYAVRLNERNEVLALLVLEH